MLMGWYYNRNNGQRLLSIDEIAMACRCSAVKVEGWFAGKILQSVQAKDACVDAGEVVAFLVRNNMPVSPSLLPPKSLKILFITTETCEIGNERKNIELLLKFFKNRGNILVENSSAGKFADLTILTFSPDVVVYFLPAHDRTSSNTLTLLSNFPELKTILFVDDSTKDASESTPGNPAPHLIFSNSEPGEQITARLCLTFGDV
jgi:hypothetical protein